MPHIKMQLLRHNKKKYLYYYFLYDSPVFHTVNLHKLILMMSNEFPSIKLPSAFETMDITTAGCSLVPWVPPLSGHYYSSSTIMNHADIEHYSLQLVTEGTIADIPQQITSVSC